MSRDRLPPPTGEACLVRLRPSSQKGGTIIAEDVTDRATHEHRICNPDGYRPAFCPNCGDTTLHVHDYRERVLRAEPGAPVAPRDQFIASAWDIAPGIGEDKASWNTGEGQVLRGRSLFPCSIR